MHAELLGAGLDPGTTGHRLAAVGLLLFEEADHRREFGLRRPQLGQLVGHDPPGLASRVIEDVSNLTQRESDPLRTPNEVDSTHCVGAETALASDSLGWGDESELVVVAQSRRCDPRRGSELSDSE